MTSDEKLTPTRRLVIGAITLGLAAAGFGAGRLALRATERVDQPIQFNHLKHVQDVGLECSTCHEYYETRQHSGLPPLSTCMGCHAEPVTDSPEEQKLVKLAAETPEPRFKKLFQLPGHSYYSHSRHVAVAEIACETCHGAIAETTRPPSRPLVRITMDTCTTCHDQQNVRTDCTACHR